MLPITRPKQKARRYYNRLSKIYDWLTVSERVLVEKGANILAPTKRETLLEIGCGTGTGLTAISEGLDGTGKLFGLDLAFNMLREARHKKFFSQTHAILLQGEAIKLPIGNAELDGVLCTFILELFSKAEMLEVLNEIHRGLRPQGRLVVVALSSAPCNLAVRIYELSHRLFPVALDCRPIPLTEILREAGFRIGHSEKMMNWGLPVDIVLAHQDNENGDTVRKSIATAS